MNQLSFESVLFICFLANLGTLVCGYLLGRIEGNAINKQRTNNNPFLAQSKDLGFKPGGIFAPVEDTTAVGAVQRPSAAQLNKWNEEPKTKEAKEALSESFANDKTLNNRRIIEKNG